MITITEMRGADGAYFEEEISGKGNKSIYSVITYPTIVKEIDGVTYCLLYDDNMVPVHDVYRFLNDEIGRQSINTRTKALYAVKLLFCFQRIIGKELAEFTKTDIEHLKLFLHGGKIPGTTVVFRLETKRDNATVNSYLSVFRQFLKSIGKENRFLSEQISLYSYATQEISAYKQTRYTADERVMNDFLEVPEYISVEDFANVVKVIRKHGKNAKRDEIIVRLMYQCGCRIGEVLGATADDFVVEKEGEEYNYALYIRNRCSDKADQLAKTCMSVTDPATYKSRGYNTLNDGYQRVIIPKDLFDMINDYIDAAHAILRVNKEENYFNHAKADRVRKEEPYEGCNYYVFLNNQGYPLSQQLWNRTLRRVFSEAGIIVDKKVRSHNLNHRFRHGFAMFNIQYLHKQPLELQKLMRHRSIQSVSIYYKPSLADQIRIKTEFTENLYSIIAGLSYRENG